MKGGKLDPEDWDKRFFKSIGTYLWHCMLLLPRMLEPWCAWLGNLKSYLLKLV